jgi:uncharacterized protein (DUF2141 family)
MRVQVRVSGLRGAAGQVLASLFTNAKGFPSEHVHAFQKHRVGITNGVAEIAFTNIPPGDCAIAVCHDENANGDMDLSLFGRPREGHATYRDARRRFGAPRFRDAAFTVGTNAVEVEVEMSYPRGPKP